MRKALTKAQVTAAIEGKGQGQVPLVFHKWWGMGLEEKYKEELNEMAGTYPDDIFYSFYTVPGEDSSYTANSAYRWGYKDYSQSEGHSIGERKVLLEDWEELDAFLEAFPDPMESGTFDIVQKELEGTGEDTYKLGCWWHFLHERFWNIRGMENLMMDYYDAMDELKILGRRIIEFHKKIVDRYAQLGFDGIFSSDDLGHQSGPMMSPTIFKELYFPLYKEFIDYVHSKGMHFFLHSCGDNSLLMDDLIAAGLDVFHPVQKGCMDAEETMRKYGGKITFLAGFDVQHIICEGTPAQVAAEVAHMKRVFGRPEGRLLMAAGNGIMPDTPLENIEAMLAAMSRE